MSPADQPETGTGPATPPAGEVRGRNRPPAWADALAQRWDRFSRVPPGAAVIAALLLTAGLWAALQRAEPYLGHDESVYAGRARSMLTGSPAVGWMVYRPVGLPYLGYLALAVGRPVGDDTLVLRLLGLLLVLATLGIVYLVGARVTSPWRAAVALLVVVGGATFLRRMPEFLDDIPSAGTLLLTAYLVLRSRRPGGRWALPAAGGVAVVTVLLRYGAIAGLLSIAGAAVLVWGPRVWLRAWREVAVAAAVTVVGLTPLAVHSYRQTGSVLGLLVRAEVTAHRAYVGQGLVYYAQAFPAKLAGPLGAVAMTVALVAVARTAPRLLSGHVPEPGHDQERLFLGVAAVLEVLLLGLVAHGESRFAVFTVFALVILGVDVLAEASGDRSRPVLAATAVTALAAIVLTTAVMYHQITGATANVRAVASVAQRLRTDVARQAGTAPGTGTSCLVVTRMAIESGWASGCDAAEPDAVDHLPDEVTVYVITFPGTPGWSGLTRIRASAPQRSWTMVPVPSADQLGDAVVAVSAPAAGGTSP